MIFSNAFHLSCRVNWLALLFTVNGLHLQGTWAPYQRYHFLTKFGVQRTKADELEASRGYVYGNVTLFKENCHNCVVPGLATLVLVDSEFILGLYGNGTELALHQDVSGVSALERSWLVENERCRRMFTMIDGLAWHRTCSPKGQMDLLRSVPCPSGGLCIEEDNVNRVMHRSQFTYTVQDLRQPRYWYLSLVACSRNPVTCEWETTSVQRPSDPSFSPSQMLSYNVWLVNGVPHLQGFNRFEHQFSFESHDTMEIYLVFLALYLALAAVAHVKSGSPCLVHSSLFLGYSWLSVIGALLTTIHLGVFSSDGEGLGRLSETGTLFAEWADAIFLALLVSTAEMGFTPELSRSKLIRASPNDQAPPSYCSYQELDSSDQASYSTHSFSSPWPYLICLVLSFLSVKTVLFIWAILDQDPVIDFSVWNTVPGCILLAVRFAVGFWFLVILRRRHLISAYTSPTLSLPLEDSTYYLGPGVDLVHFAAGFLLWMFVLPIVVFIAETSVSSLWRDKVITSICFSADFVAACVYLYLLSRCRKTLHSPGLL